MSKFDNDLKKYAEELGVDEAVIYPPQQPTGVQPGIKPVPGQPVGVDLNTLLAQHKPYADLLQQHQQLTTKMAQASAEALKNVMATLQQQAAGGVQPQAGNPAGTAPVAPTAPIR